MTASGIDATITEIADEFAFFSDWEERYAHIIDLARALPDPSVTPRARASSSGRQRDTTPGDAVLNVAATRARPGIARAHAL